MHYNVFLVQKNRNLIFCSTLLCCFLLFQQYGTSSYLLPLTVIFFFKSKNRVLTFFALPCDSFFPKEQIEFLPFALLWNFFISKVRNKFLPFCQTMWFFFSKVRIKLHYRVIFFSKESSSYLLPYHVTFSKGSVCCLCLYLVIIFFFKSKYRVLSFCLTLRFFFQKKESSSYFLPYLVICFTKGI